MKTPIRLAAVIVAVSTGTPLFAQGFNLRPGTWEFTMSVQGSLPTAGIPPEMRAQIEAEMRKPQVYSSCVTSEDIKSLNLGKKDDDDDEDCTVVTSRMTPTTADITRQCTGDEPRTETAHFEAATPQSLRANISTKGASGAMTMSVIGKWVAAPCKE